MQNTTHARLSEITFADTTQFKKFLMTMIGSPIQLVTSAVSSVNGEIHAIFDHLGINEQALVQMGAIPTDQIAFKPGYTPVTFSGKDPVTNIYLLATIQGARENQYFDAFRNAILAAVIGENGKIIKDAGEHNVLVTVGSETDRVLYATIDGEEWIDLDLEIITGASQFVYGPGVIGQAQIGDTRVYGLPLVKLQRVFEGQLSQNDLVWNQVAELDDPIAYFSRSWDNGGVIISTQPLNVEQTSLHGYRFYAKTGGAMLTRELKDVTILPEGLSGVIGRTSVGAIDGKSTIAFATKLDQSGIRGAKFIPQTELPQSVIGLINQMNNLS